VGRKVDVDDLLDANGVAELLGFAHRNTVSVYQHRYPDMPRPVREFGDRRAKLWLRSEIESWRADRQRSAEQSPTTDLDANDS
jgi:predicted DNA-binding transcriptional regulator AlpA